jgi:hypothetical protein
VSWPRDDAKLDRVRALMAAEELDTLVCAQTRNDLFPELAGKVVLSSHFPDGGRWRR